MHRISEGSGFSQVKQIIEKLLLCHYRIIYNIYLEINARQKEELSAKPKERAINVFGFLYILFYFIY